ncbi:MAG: hypothetical protein JWM11_5532 [Planctomycetaceae bacterium]|nr:hypothetical protein [Planctomycetaceae bacterium]
MDRNEISAYELLGGWFGIILRIAALVVVGATLIPSLCSEILQGLGLL